MNIEERLTRIEAHLFGKAERPTEQPVYEAGFWFSKTHDIVLNLPDKSMIWMTYTGWAKTNRGVCESHPHTLNPVSQHTVGKFYAVKGASGEHLNDYRNYALCVKSGEWPHFVKPKIDDGIVVVESNTLVHVSNLEVRPIQKQPTQ